MDTSLATKQTPEASSRHKPGMVGVFYLLTFLTGGFFLSVGNSFGFIVDVIAASFYIAVTVLFYSVSKRA
jgi:hypothetical protein